MDVVLFFFFFIHMNLSNHITPSLIISNTHQTGNDEVADDDSSHGPPALLLTGIKEDDAPEHVKQDDGHGHEG